MQWKQGVVLYIIVYIVLLNDTTPIHCTPSDCTPLCRVSKVRAAVRDVLHTSSPVLPADRFAGEPYYGALFVRLAAQCAYTFRATDHLGGCNGARVRFAPQKDWRGSAALDKALLLLAPIQARFGGLTWADLIVLAGTVAAEEAGAPPMRFCGGRSDAEDRAGSLHSAKGGAVETGCSDLYDVTY